MGLYTKTGDSGSTQLIGGERVPKYDPRVEAYGTVDELSAHIALLCDMLSERTPASRHIAPLREILHKLMSVEALLAVGQGAEHKVDDLPEECIEWIEKQIDSMSDAVPAITKFTIPGGDMLVSQSHVCRTVCRRAERRAAEAASQFPLSINALKYLNRLSDWLYIFGRTLVQDYGVEEILWIPPKKF